MVLVLRVPARVSLVVLAVFFFNDTATTEIYTLSLHDALPIFLAQRRFGARARRDVDDGADQPGHLAARVAVGRSEEHTSELQSPCNIVCRLLLDKRRPAGLAHRLAAQPAAPGARISRRRRHRG